MANRLGGHREGQMVGGVGGCGRGCEGRQGGTTSL
jgi:hypothetical protein